ncbi:MAG: endonuclease/exonuclease/phosphatase family protein [Treponema sp.]|nr:endonuclease/exonuclease/phosphatase family protein [Treponema sp.]
MKNILPCFHFLRRAASVFIAAILALGACASETKTEGMSEELSALTLMTWNIHNLFDGADNGYEYDEYLTSAGWSEEKYLGRINSVSAAIGRIEPQPDIIMLQEIESLKILEDLSLAISAGYSWSHFANNPGATLGVGILCRVPILEAKAHSISVRGETTPRPVLEARVQAGEGEIVIFVCHWKSKLGGDGVTENVRKASARVIVRRIRELWEKEPDTGVIVAGDMNENHDEFFRQGAAMICALLPDDPFCAQLTGCRGLNGEDYPALQKDFIIISRNKPPEPVHFPKGSIALFSPWLGGLENGSYFYRYNWETIDHFLISGRFFGNTGWTYEKTEVANYQPFTNAGGSPFSYNAKTGIGLSDHLPLLLTLKYK